MEFRGRQQFQDVDEKLVTPTPRCLMIQLQADGSWPAVSTVRRNDAEHNRLRTTAYVAWAVLGQDAVEARPTREFLLKHAPDTIDDPYVLALVCNALLAIDPKDESARPYLERLESIKRT